MDDLEIIVNSIITLFSSNIEGLAPAKQVQVKNKPKSESYETEKASKEANA